jgi:ketosteroid isomerase-like protein
MPQESTTPDVVELVRRYVAALNRRGPDVAMDFFAPNAVLEATGMGTSFEGVAAIRSFYEDWSRPYSEQEFEALEILDLGHGIALSVNEQRGCLAGSAREIRLRDGWVYEWVDDMIVGLTLYLDPDEARAAAEQLAESRG